MPALFFTSMLTHFKKSEYTLPFFPAGCGQSHPCRERQPPCRKKQRNHGMAPGLQEGTPCSTSSFVCCNTLTISHAQHLRVFFFIRMDRVPGFKQSHPSP